VGQARIHRRLHVALTRRAQMEGVELSPVDAERLAQPAARAAGPHLWRLALAEAASSELGLSMAEALALPELELAARLAGAPEGTVATPPAHTSAAAAPQAQTPAAPQAQTPAAPQAQTAAAPQAQTPAAPQAQAAPTPEGEAVGAASRARAAAPAPQAQAGATAPRQDAIRVGATHVEGLEAVRAGERDLELRLSAAGIDVLVGTSGAPIGRLAWEHVRDVTLQRRRRALRAALRLHVDTDQGHASFDLPGVDEREFRAALDPLLDRALRALRR